MVAANLPLQRPAHPSFWGAFGYWLKLGLISFGGPAGQIAIMHQQLVEKQRWISEKRFLHALNYCMLLPGPEAQQLAIYLGWLLHRTWGGVVAGVLFVLPSFLLLTALSWIYMAFGDTPWVAGIFYGIKPAVTAIVLYAAYRIASRSLKNHWLRALALLSFVAIFALHLPFPVIVLCAAVIGYVGGRFAPAVFRLSGGHGDGGASYGPAVVDDDSPRLAHTHFYKRRSFLIVAVGLLLWLVPMAILLARFGWDSTFTQMAWFFTKAALLTFGGAYAVLPYIYQGAVEQYHWLTSVQMIDALALGETTPGPLIMLVAFVGFVGAYTQAVLGPDALVLSGMIAALLVTWFTFLPSFIFILVGGPLVESTHDMLKFTAPLTAITAAVVGVIVNLTLFFAYHVLWPQGFSGDVDWLSAGMMMVSAIALIRFKVGVIPVIAVCAGVGLLLNFF